MFTPLGPDDPIGVVALSGPIDPERLDRGIRVLKSWQRPLIVAPNLGHRSRYLDGRLFYFTSNRNGGARTVLAARGGYGLTRLLGRVPWRRLIEDGIRFVGFSDVTALMGPLVERGGVTQVHGPMVAAGLEDEQSAERLRRLLEGEVIGRTLFAFGADEVVRHGHASGSAKGGNLSLLASLVGTPWQPDLKDAVVFLEDVGEPAYRLDRMLTHIGASGMFRGVKALISGSLCDCPGIGERSTEWRELLEEAAPPGTPIVTGISFGHRTPNMAFPLGTQITVDTFSGRIDWSG